MSRLTSKCRSVNKPLENATIKWTGPSSRKLSVCGASANFSVPVRRQVTQRGVRKTSPPVGEVSY